MNIDDPDDDVIRLPPVPPRAYPACSNERFKTGSVSRFDFKSEC